MVKRVTGKKMYLPSTPARSSPRRLKEQFVVAHHMAIIGNGSGSALDACVRTWRTRVASANAGVDGTKVGYFVHGERASWATGNQRGNHAGYNIEHANSSGAPHWRISEATRRTGARLAGQRCFDKKMGRPVSGKNLLRHGPDFGGTECPGGLNAVWPAYVAEAQDMYDDLAGKKNRKRFRVHVAQQPGDFANRPVIVRSGPGHHYKDVGRKNHGDPFTASGKTARTKSGHLWREGINGGWIADRRLTEEK